MNIAVALLSPPFSTLTYAVPDGFALSSFAVGTRILVPLGANMLRTALVLAEDVEVPENVTVRPALWPLDRVPLCDAEYIAMVRLLSAHQLSSIGQILGTVVPAELRLCRDRLRVVRDNAKPLMLTPKTLQTLVGSGESDEVLAAWNRGDADWIAPSVDAASAECCVLLRDPPWPVRPGATKQLAVLEWVLEHGTRPRRELMAAIDGAQSALTSLVKAGLLAIRPYEVSDEDEGQSSLLPPPDADHELSQRQKDCVERVRESLASGSGGVHLVYGVTGSGKTRVYMEAVKACLAQGRSAIILAPEVALAIKLRRDAEQALAHVPGISERLYFFHGYQPSSRRARMFSEIALRREPCVVVGTRSALFLPVRSPGLIILDEEHDASFKQDEGLIYHAKELAWYRTAMSRTVLMLGSATPDIKTFHAAQNDRIMLSHLPERVGGGVLPDIRLVDIRHHNPTENVLAPESMAALKATVAAGNQAVILLNLRGYAPRMVCRGCGKVVRCPHCDIGMTYHKGRERLVCHYCGHTVPFPSLCPTCKSMQFTPMGQGTERIEEFLAHELPPDCKVLRLDRDSTRRPGRMEEILEAFAERKAQVLVGTQMLSKGHHFPHVTLALVADGDIGLNTPDYRACERTFQLLVQSAGRAGRGGQKGEVIIQTRDPEHYCWKYVRDADYEGFYHNELARRQSRRYPPFVKLGLIRLSYPLDWEGGEAEVARLTSVLKAESKKCGVTVLGPAPALHEFMRGRRHLRCMLKASSWQLVRTVYAAMQADSPSVKLRLSLDLDPVSMM